MNSYERRMLAKNAGIDLSGYMPIDHKKINIEKLNKACDWADNNNHRKPYRLSKSKDEQEHANLIARLREAARGRGGRVWHNEYAQTVESRGYGWFKFKDKKEARLDRFKQAMDWADENSRKRPSHRSVSNLEKKFSGLITSIKKAKRGIGSEKWYPEYDEMAKARGYDWLDIRSKDDDKKIAIDKFKNVIRWAKENGRKPSSYSKKSGSAEYGHGLLIRSLKDAKNGKGTNLWYPEYEEIAKSHGYDWFDFKDIKSRQLAKFQKIIEWANSHNRKPVGSAGGNKEEIRFANIISALKGAKNNRNNKIKWYPEYEEIAKSNGYDWFD